MKKIFSLLTIAFSFSALAAGNCDLSIWNTEKEKINDAYANGQIAHQEFFTLTKRMDKIISRNVYECVYMGKTADLSKEVIASSLPLVKADRAYKIANTTKLIDFEIKNGSPEGAVKAKIDLEKMNAKYNKIETAIAEISK